MCVCAKNFQLSLFITSYCFYYFFEVLKFNANSQATVQMCGLQINCMVTKKGVANVKICDLQINYMATHLQEDPQVIGTVYIPITKSV